MLGQQRWAVSLDQHLDLAEQLPFLAIDVTDPLEDRSGDPDLRAEGKTAESSRDLCANLRTDQTLRSNLGFELWSDLHQMPTQPTRKPNTAR
jgi:hypothetical protein